MKKTKIVCTIGPSTESKEMLLNLLKAGMNVMRLNFSHGSYEEHGNRIKKFREVLYETGLHGAIILDTKGPEIRTMKLKNKKNVFLKKNQFFSFTTNRNFIGNNTCVAVTYSNFEKDLSIGKKILIDDGLLEMIVVKISNNLVTCRVLNNGYLGENKGINLPNVKTSLPSLAKKDKEDIVFGIKKDVDFIAASFIRKKEDVLKIRKYLDEHGGKNIQIISKIENQEGLNNFDDILEISDGIMVARGDLGVEIPVEEVIFAQKMIISKCNHAKKVVITATQMLDSMIKNPRPTRAEAGDVANAILDGTDAVMLSGESATGKYPLESVSIMATICEKTDQMLPVQICNISSKKLRITEAVCRSAVETAENLASPLIVVLTESGRSAKSIRKYFPKAEILALTSNPTTVRQLTLSKGITCKLIKKISSIEEFHYIGKSISIKSKFANKGDTIVMVSGIIPSNGITNTSSVYVL